MRGAPTLSRRNVVDIVLAFAVAAGCGGRSYTNTLHTPRSTLAEVGAPHIPIAVENGTGLVRVWLDTGKSEPIGDAKDTTAIDATTTLTIENGQYVIARAGARTVVADVAAKSPPEISPDRKWLAIAEDKKLLMIAVADGAVHRYAVPPGPRAY